MSVAISSFFSEIPVGIAVDMNLVFRLSVRAKRPEFDFDRGLEGSVCFDKPVFDFFDQFS